MHLARLDPLKGIVAQTRVARPPSLGVYDASLMQTAVATGRTATGREAFHSVAVRCGPELSRGVIFHGRDPFERTLERRAERGENCRHAAHWEAFACMRGMRRMA